MKVQSTLAESSQLDPCIHRHAATLTIGRSQALADLRAAVAESLTMPATHARLALSSQERIYRDHRVRRCARSRRRVMGACAYVCSAQVLKGATRGSSARFWPSTCSGSRDLYTDVALDVLDGPETLTEACPAALVCAALCVL
jgi:hypothetical protein